MSDYVQEKLLDPTGKKILKLIKENARISYKDLSKLVNLSPPAVAERIKKMEEIGIIEGYFTKINMEKIGFPIQAMIHLRKLGPKGCDWVAEQLEDIPEIEQIIRITGDDSMMLKIAVVSTDQLTDLVDHVSQYGIPETSLLRPEGDH